MRPGIIYRIGIILLLSVLPVIAAAEPNACCEAAQPVQVEKLSPELEKLLTKVERRGESLKSFQAAMLYEQLQPLTDTMMIRTGDMYYQADEKTVRFRIHFADNLQMDTTEEKRPKPVKFNEDFAFDGMWVTRRNERTKSIQRRQIARTARNKEDFRLGKGPFPLPFALKRDDIVKEFDIKLLKPDPKDKTFKDADHLLLKPKPKSSFAEKYVKLELWLAKKDTVPVRMRYEVDNAETTTVTWSKIKIDKNIKAATFDLQPGGGDWDVEVIPMKPEVDTSK
jgi:outer membrane lipoprotein-sorting protein